MAFLAVAVTALTGVLGISFAQTQQTERLAAAAVEQAQASNAIRLVESLDSRAQGAVITVAAFNAELTGEEERDQAIENVVEVEEAIATSPNPLLDASLAEEVSSFVGLLESGDTTEARQFLDSSIRTETAAVVARARTQSQEAATVIEVETGVAGGWGLVTSFGVGLLAPLLALGVFRTFVNRRRRQEHLEQQLARVQELGQAKDDMIANLSHELRTPLTGIYGFALALEDVGFADPELSAEMNSYIIRDAADLSRMVDDLLVAAKAETGGLSFSPEAISVEREVDEVLVPMKTSQKAFVKDLQDVQVEADRLRVRQILRNLISNAEKHGGQNVEIVGRQVGDRYRVEVIDDGEGVSEEVSARLFKRFVHDGDAPLTEGSVGVGLAVAQALATGMDSFVEHRQRAGSTVFTLDLPVASGASEPAPSNGAPATPEVLVGAPLAPEVSPSMVGGPPAGSPKRRFRRGPSSAPVGQPKKKRRVESALPTLTAPAALIPPPAPVEREVERELAADPFA